MFLFIVIVFFVLLSAAFMLSLIKRDQGEREPITALWAAIGFGLLGAVMASFLEGFLLKNDLQQVQSTGDAFVTAMTVGVIEEACKSVLLIVFIYKRRYFNEHTDGVIYFALAGMGFGLPENVLYTVAFGAKVGLVRVVLTPVFHAATTAIVGFTLARVKLDNKPKINVVLALALVMVLHGLYDFGAASGNGFFILLSISITLGLTVNLFMMFTRAKHLDQQQGLSVVGNNSFCRSCGFANPKHNLYCSRCGKRA